MANISRVILINNQVVTGYTINKDREVILESVPQKKPHVFENQDYKLISTKIDKNVGSMRDLLTQLRAQPTFGEIKGKLSSQSYKEYKKS